MAKLSREKHSNLSKIDIYRPQRSCGKVMFLHLSVILFTGWVSAPVHAGIHPPGRHPPCPVHAGIDMATAADGTHPAGMRSCFDCFYMSTQTFHMEPFRSYLNLPTVKVADVK